LSAGLLDFARNDMNARQFPADVEIKSRLFADVFGQLFDFVALRKYHVLTVVFV